MEVVVTVVCVVVVGAVAARVVGVGVGDGFVVGVLVGSVIGVFVGFLVGFLVGFVVGLSVGLAMGFAVGWAAEIYDRGVDGRGCAVTGVPRGCAVAVRALVGVHTAAPVAGIADAHLLADAVLSGVTTVRSVAARVRGRQLGRRGGRAGRWYRSGRWSGRWSGRRWGTQRTCAAPWQEVVLHLPNRNALSGRQPCGCRDLVLGRSTARIGC